MQHFKEVLSDEEAFKKASADAKTIVNKVHEEIDKKEVIELLTDISDWMCENDYECGPVGSELLQEIEEMILKLKNK